VWYHASNDKKKNEAQFNVTDKKQILTDLEVSALGAGSILSVVLWSLKALLLGLALGPWLFFLIHQQT